MKITFFIGGLSGGGAERVTCNLANHLYERGYDVTILTMADDAPTYFIGKGVKRVPLLKDKERKGFIYNTSLRFLRFIRMVRSGGEDVFVVMLPVTTILMLQFRGFIKAKVIAAERVDPSNYSIKKQNQLKRLAHKADGWVFQTAEERNWYGETTKNAKVSIIPNAINPDFIQPAYAGERRKVIVSAGRMSVQKNQELLVRAFAAVCKDFPDYQLVIYGEGEKRSTLTAVAEELGIKNKVQLPGYTTNIGEKIKDASLFVLSSDFEGMPNALMEAMALGLPCISTDCDGGGAKFLIENEKNGLLVPKGDKDALAAAMKRMLADREFAEQCGEEAHKICEQLAPDKVYGQWEKFIKEIVNGKQQ